ncbi:IclR family transcriptional regulator [Aeromicrobium sp. CTD01-1L150]|uniref:IclR family transcriptional regulator n=1 Tax=Aeromicrobium sp. CTD01-1L150 TaxID=3341830 RepID=UPI0035C14CD6
MTSTNADAPEGSTTPAAAAVRKRHRMVDRVAAILESVARSSEGLTLTDLARTLDAPVSSIQGLVNGLIATGYLEERERRYFLGTAPYLLNLIVGRRMVTRVTPTELENISAETGLTTLLAIAVGSDVFYIDSCTSEARYEYLSKNLVRRSLIRTSSGWVLLSGMPQRDLWAYLSSRPPEDEELVERFLRALGDIRETGLCAGPQISDIADGVSAAVHEDGRLVATVSVVGSSETITARRDDLVDVLRRHKARWDGNQV